MVKKIKKYVKFVVCCALIMSLVAPSYAALSASDGSAFVTKAEFDAALADFNARLTSFESGINSKIDSQVTSYLDRNGIWNGKDIESINKYYVWGNLTNIPSNFDHSLVGVNKTINWGSGVTHPKNEVWSIPDTMPNSSFGEFYNTTYKLFSNLPKAGLLVLDCGLITIDTLCVRLGFTTSLTRPGVAYWQAVIDDHSQNASCYSLYVGGRLSTALGPSRLVKQDIVLRNADITYNSSGTSYDRMKTTLGMTCIPATQHWSVFVEKGSDLEFEVYLAFTKAFTNNIKLYGVIEDPGYVFYFTGMRIY